MRVFLSSPTFDIAGHVALDVFPRSAFHGVRRRVSRVATLDGGAVINDFGFSHGDTTIDLSWRPVDDAERESVARLIELYGRINIATRSGVYLAAPESYEPGPDEARLRLLVMSKLSA